MRIVIGIETSCDETAVAIVTENYNVLSHILHSQMEHDSFGGVVPEIASRLHMESLSKITTKAISSANIAINDIDAVAATGGPGLIGSLTVGLTFGKAIAYCLDKPFIAINHIEAHALAIRSQQKLDFPFVSLIISGGHCQFVLSLDIGIHEYIGGTIDDALGETFDKVSVMLGLGYPGGPAIEKCAQSGNPNAFAFPQPLAHRKSCDFSFSGLKTAVRMVVAKYNTNDITFRNDLCASFQKCVTEILIDRITNVFKSELVNKITRTLVICGGVSKNEFIRTNILDFAKNRISVFFPPHELCTDNGIMIATTGVEYMKHCYYNDFSFPPKPKWDLQDSLYGKLRTDLYQKKNN